LVLTQEVFEIAKDYIVAYPAVACIGRMVVVATLVRGLPLFGIGLAKKI
jgi:hypothetical protein